MPGNPFREKKAIARLEIQRIKPEHDWECTNMDANGVHLFEMGGGIHVTGQKMDKNGKGKDMSMAGTSAQQVGSKNFDKQVDYNSV